MLNTAMKAHKRELRQEKMLGVGRRQGLVEAEWVVQAMVVELMAHQEPPRWRLLPDTSALHC